MKIAILLPYKENFSPQYPGAVSLFVNETSKISTYKKNIVVFGSTNFKKRFKLKYINIKSNKNPFESQTKIYVNEFIRLQNSHNFSIIEIAEKIAKFTNISNISIGKSNADERSYNVNFDLLKNTLPNYEFIYNLDNGILDLIENFSKYIDSYNSRRLKKIKFLIRKKEIDEMLYWN